jgi:hypothetical protein
MVPLVASLISGAASQGGQKGSAVSGILQGGAVGGLVGSIIDLIASGKSGDELNQAIEAARSQVNTGYDQAQQYYAPYVQMGNEDYSNLRNMVRSGAFDVSQPQFNGPAYNAQSDFNYDKFRYQDFQFNHNEDPGAKYRLEAGLEAIKSAGAANQTLLSGSTLKALQKYGSDIASQEYQNAFNRYNTNLNNALRIYNTNYGNEYGRYFDKKTFDYNKYVGDRNFAYGAYSDDYNRRRANALDRYQRYGTLANMGPQMAGQMAGLSIGRYGDLANLDLQRGNVNAGLMQSRGNILGGMAQMTLGGDMSGSSRGSSQMASLGGGQYQQQPYSYAPYNEPYGYQAPTAYPNGVPNSTYNGVQGDYPVYNQNQQNPIAEENKSGYGLA